MTKPNLFIVGAPKCATTFLYNVFKENYPEIFCTKIKELNFFTNDFLKSESYYKDYRVKNLNDYYSKYRAAAKELYLTDFSVSYFTYPEVAKRIKEFNPKAKIIIVYRNPIERAYSHIEMDARMGISKKIEDITPGTFVYRQYILNSMFYLNLNNYLEYFSRDNILVLNSKNMEEELEKINQFLGLQKREISSNLPRNEKKYLKNSLGKILIKNRSKIEKIKALFPFINFSRLSRFFLYSQSASLTNDDVSIELKKSHLSEIEKDFEQFQNYIINEGNNC